MNVLQQPENLYLALLLFGVFCAAFFLLLAWLTQVVKQGLLWVDDRKAEGPFPMTVLIAKLWGYKHRDGIYFEKKGHGDKDSMDLLGCTAIGIVFLPLAINLSIKFYPVVMSLALLYGLAHTARFARRHKKLFDEHVKDPEAHK